MPYQKSFRILLEEDNTDGSILDSKGGASFLSLNGTDSGGTMNADSHVLGFDGTQSEGKPGWLSENADGGGDYAKRLVHASNSGWIMTPGSAATGSDNTNSQPEVLENLFLFHFFLKMLVFEASCLKWLLFGVL